MAKTFDKCKICKSKKFLNSINLCKKCARTPASAAIRSKAMAANDAADAAQAKFDEKEAAFKSEHPDETVEAPAQASTEAPAAESDKKE